MSTTRHRPGPWAGYAAAAWGALFAAASLYWAAGGQFGLNTLSPRITGNHGFWFVLLGLWGAGVAKLVAGALGLALTGRPRRRTARPLLVLGGLTGFALSLYGGLNLAARALMAIGVLDTPASMHTTAATWHLLLWDPWWLAGGLLFLAATRGYGRRMPRRRPPRRVPESRPPAVLSGRAGR